MSGAPPAPDFAALRARFPVLRERTYFDTQSVGPFPEQMLIDLDEYRRTLFLRNRGMALWIERMEELIGLLERLLAAPRDAVALMPSATAAQAAIAATQVPRGRRDRILYTALDFHSSQYLWEAQKRRGFQVIEVPSTDGATPTNGLVERIDERVAVVALSLVSPRTGALADLRAIVEVARARGALVVVDAYQAVGVVPIDVAALDVDVLVGGTHKWLCGGSTGLSFLYVRPALAESLEPVYPGWIGHREMVGFAPSYEPARGARRFMQGSPAIEPVYTARAGLQFVLDAGVEAIRARNLSLTERLMARADERGLSIRTPRPPHARGGSICLAVEEGERIVAELARDGIDIDTRPGGVLRVGPHACNTEEECDRVIDAIGRARN
ncbi:aminotransferase class V-fold PLP-dependent enzyme [Polyangium jinanense]|uniref:Aminotransferase class V-fold PLP-dependent enzyme n=1 Tax=Polyangium jinanense TaxID=2829994 RepID=A0A9X3X9I2_9BACT|nr:aminotransferase class V-fold PLP-dependent enzyme [Polyangium jinanense]MDC3959956.1 aminotransferase class V-fold PLP-dependent enzyme [Polyangium jinanense]MDC3983836.1 aminotransferase class V-fold PLP-dependent enzyme [Polyangium jinanense]